VGEGFVSLGPSCRNSSNSGLISLPDGVHAAGFSAETHGGVVPNRLPIHVTSVV